MRNLNKKQSIALFVGLALIAYVFFGDILIGFFNSNASQATPMEENTLVKAEDLKVGTGALAEAGDNLTVHYVGKLVDGRVFDSSLDRNTPFDFTLGVGSVIRGWDEGLKGMKVGGKRILTIAPEYAYGSSGIGTIPPNATLIFEVELLDVQSPR